MLLSIFERPRPSTKAAPTAWRLVLGVLLCSWGLAMLALKGVGTEDHAGVDWPRLATPFVGAALAGLLRP
jgi:hypothetical protein